ncbi:hypothetical protein [Yoonia sp.]|uniref:hypothetical protein n=1 Tax=Yoonia sp. TaxID=2212373 RepID=UPI002FD91933
MLRLLALACPLLAPAIAMACNPPTILIETNGDATYMSPETDTRPALEDIFGPAPRPDMILVVDSRTRGGTWIEPDVLGGFGAIMNASELYPVYSGPDACRPPELPIALPEGAPLEAPIDLFPDEPTETGPRSGLWQAKVGPTAMEGCPATMASAFPASGGALAGMTGEPRRMVFSSPFHPDTLELSQTTGVRWQAAGENRWVTTDMGAQAFAQIPQGQGGGSRIVWTLTVVSPAEISFRRAIEIVFPAEAAALMGASPDGCRVTGTDRWVRIGD